MKDLKEDLRKAIKTGKVVLGSKKVIRGLLNNEVKLVITGKTCPAEIAERVKYYCALGKIPHLLSDKRALELGEAVGVAHNISAIGIVKEGESKILEVTKKEH